MVPPGRLESRRMPRRRPTGDILAGAGAVLILLVLLIGVPAALLTALGSPIPHTMPALSLLTHRLDILARVVFEVVLNFDLRTGDLRQAHGRDEAGQKNEPPHLG
jgi:hypothetical protein